VYSWIFQAYIITMNLSHVWLVQYAPSREQSLLGAFRLNGGDKDDTEAAKS